MRRDFEELFSQLEPSKPLAGLFDKVIWRIRQEERRRACRWKFALSSVLFAVSAFASISTFASASSALAESGFMEFLSLFWSDAGVLVAYWNDFIFVLIESLPVASVAVFLAALFVLLQSLRFMVLNSKIISIIPNKKLWI